MVPRLAAALVVAALMLAAGCSDDSSSSSATDSPTSATTPDAPEAPPSAADPTEATPDEVGLPFPDVAPATGRAVRGETVQVNAPEGWFKTPAMVDFSSGAYAQGDALLQLTDKDTLGDGNLANLSVEELGALILEGAEQRGGDFELLPPLVLDGVPVARIGGTDSGGLQVVKVSVEHEGRTVSLTLESSAGILKRNSGLFESVLNTWRWR